MLTITLPRKDINPPLLHEELTRAFAGRFASLATGDTITIGILDFVPEAFEPVATYKFDLTKTNEENEALQAAIIAQNDRAFIEHTAQQTARKAADSADVTQKATELLQAHDATRLTAAQIKERAASPTRTLTLERQGVNHERLAEELKESLGEHFGGLGSGKGKLFVHLLKTAPEEAENTARQLVLKHDMTKHSSAQIARQEAAAKLETAKAQTLEALPEKPTTDNLLKALLAQVQALTTRIEHLETRG